MKREKNKWRDAGQEAHDEWLRKQSDEDLRRLAGGAKRTDDIEIGLSAIFPRHIDRLDPFR